MNKCPDWGTELTALRKLVREMGEIVKWVDDTQAYTHAGVEKKSAEILNRPEVKKIMEAK